MPDIPENKPKTEDIQNLADNPNVQELFAILKENDKDTAGLTALLSYVSQMETFVKSAETQISDMKQQITELKEIQKHPIKTALKNASDSLKANVDKVKEQLTKIKQGIVQGCKNAVQAIKDSGTIALDKLSDFFQIKQGFEAIEKNTAIGMTNCDKSVTKIERFATEYHSVGLAVKNIARMTIGKEPVDKPKEVGKMAKAMCAPYQLEKKCLNNIGDTAIKAFVKLDDLSIKADEIRKERQERKQEKQELKQQQKAEKKPSVDEMFVNAEAKLAERNGDKGIPMPEIKPKVAIAGAEL